MLLVQSCICRMCFKAATLVENCDMFLYSVYSPYNNLSQMISSPNSNLSENSTGMNSNMFSIYLPNQEFT